MNNNMEPQKSDRALKEEAVLKFWQENQIFEKTLEKPSPKGEFVFYDGPPFATGLPHAGSLLSSVIKDVVPRYKTMRGFSVRRRWGWDCHGLPIENMIEKELGLKDKTEIEGKIGIEAFNEACRSSVLRYAHDWKKYVDRVGRWVDYDNAYKTMDNTYIESVWQAVKKINEKGLLYEGRKVLLYCPHCQTPIAKAEVAMDNSYRDVTEESVYVKFKIKGFDKAYFLAWTTTPWTLPGNVALAVGKEIEYVEAKVGEEILVLAKERLAVLGESYEIVATHKGSEMVGMEYEPLFKVPAAQESGKKGWYVTDADFVSVEDGTGIVHTAVIYGEDDYSLGLAKDLPMVQLLDSAGHFNDKAPELIRGQYFKKAEKLIKEDLETRRLLFKREMHTHSYPHCHRCGTALLYNAISSWFFNIQKVKGQMIALNEKVNWVPAHLKHGRFLNIVENAPDWTISRNRYWAAPLPIWKDESGKVQVIGSLDEFKKYAKKSGNAYFLMRHGGTEGNAKELVSYKNEVEDHLTPEGRKQAEESAKGLVGKKIDLIISSPFARTKETAEIVRQSLNLPESALMLDERLKEVDPGEFDGKDWGEYHRYIYSTGKDWYQRQIPGGESLREVGRRVGSALYDLESKYQGKNILLVTHGGPAWLAFVVSGLYRPDNEEYKVADSHVFVKSFKRFDNAEVRELPFVPLPHNKFFELDLHRPYIDEVVLEKNGEEYKRVKEVMDVWFDSGSMPFAQDPTNVRLPADFISEAIDQTRGWFYTLHAVGVLMGQSNVYKNVICLGHILDKNGKKMSKSVGNVVNPWEMVDKYGVDALRLWMYSVNQPGESKNFDERTVDELQKRVFNLLDNVHSFYELYRDKSCENNGRPKSRNILDRWIIDLQDQLIRDMTDNLDSYKLLEPVRALREFVDSLSTWYLRRSRERIKEGDKEAKATLYFVLKRTALLLAPFAPFTAEDLYQKLKIKNDHQSVHLCEWPSVRTSTLSSLLNLGEGWLWSRRGEVLSNMQETRRLVSLALEERNKANIKVRQPLAKLAVKSLKLPSEYTEIIRDEINVKEVVADSSLETEVKLYTTLTPELIEEGKVREAIRAVQEWRKTNNLKPGEVAAYSVPAGEEEFFHKHSAEIKRATNIEF